MICLINEFKKIWNVKTIIILTLILAIINIIYVGAEGTNSKSDWKSVAKENRQLDEEYLKEFEVKLSQLVEAGQLKEDQKKHYEDLLDTYRIRMKGFTHKDQKPYWT